MLVLKEQVAVLARTMLQQEDAVVVFAELVKPCPDYTLSGYYYDFEEEVLVLDFWYYAITGDNNRSYHQLEIDLLTGEVLEDGE